MRQGVLLIHHCWYTSFSVVAQHVGAYLERYYAEVRFATEVPAVPLPGNEPEAVLYIHDSVDLLRHPADYYLRGRAVTAAWSDTCLDAALYDDLRPLSFPHVVASEVNRSMFEPYGAVAALPRVFNAGAVEAIMKAPPAREDYFAACGYVEESDRKNFGQLKEVVDRTGIRVKALTNVEGPWERVPYASLNEEDKYRLFAQARFLIFLSSAEGFGMPPLEAMSVGTPVIYSDVPAHNSFCVGVSIPTAGPPQAVSFTQPTGHPFRATLRRCDIERAVGAVEAARTMDPAQYVRLSRKARERALPFHPNVAIETFYRRYLRPAGG